MTHFPLRKTLTALLLLLGCWLGLRFLLDTATPFLLAIPLALAAEPLVKTLQKRLKLPRGIASALGVVLVLTLTVLLVATLFALLIRELGSLAGIMPDLEQAALSGLDSLEGWLLGLARKAPKGVGAVLTHGVEGMFSNSSALLDQASSKLLALASGLLKSLPDSALGLGTWVLATFMLSSRLPKIRQWLVSQLPESWHQRIAPSLSALKKTLGRWLLAQGKLVLITFSLLTAGFLFLRIDHALLWAAAVCLVDILPILGTGTVLIPWSLVCFLQGDTFLALGILGIYTMITLVRSVLEPRFVGKGLGLDPLLTLLAIYVGYRLWGLLGMLIAPLLAVAVTQILLGQKKQL